MQKTKLLFTLLLLGSAAFTIITSLGNLHEHASHLFYTLLLQTLGIIYIWKDAFKGLQGKTHKGLMASVAVFSLFLFVSAHVIPTGMLMDQHDSHQASDHQSQHACCIPAMPVAQLESLDSVLGYVLETTREPKRIHALASKTSDTGRSPPLV